VKLIVGLGNPGSTYSNTRHNVGFEVVDLVAARHHLEWVMAPRGIQALDARWRAAGAVIAKPLTFMNLSGQAIVGLLQFFKVDLVDLLVIVDEVQLETGRLRARASGSAGGHNGLKSVIAALGTHEFSRLRIGVGRGDARRDLSNHVLSRVEPASRPVLDEAIQQAADAAELFVTDGILAVMRQFNRKKEDTNTEDNRPS
jgi:peptidyl-tRNA hydrolase, PTH1 family